MSIYSILTLLFVYFIPMQKKGFKQVLSCRQTDSFSYNKQSFIYFTYNAMSYFNSKSQINADLHGSEVEMPEIQDQRLQKVQQIRMQQHQTKSQNVNNLHQNFTAVQFKKELIKLMTLVKLEPMGYKSKNVKLLLNAEINNLQDIQSVKNSDLNQISEKLVEDILQILIEGRPQVNFKRRRISQSLKQQKQNNDERLQMNELSLDRELVIMVIKKPHRQILCTICYNLTSKIFQSGCLHTFCQVCMLGYIRQNIASGTYFINCPEFQCKEIISIESTRKLLEVKQYQRFVYFQEKTKKELDPNNKFCVKPDCGELLTKQKDRLICEKCHENYCEICLQQYHQGQKCDKVLKQTLQQTYHTFNIKKCPSCKSPIEKSEGCNHMNCKKCKYQFCWICLKKYSKHHFRTYNCFGCPGMQFQDEAELYAERCKQVFFYFLLPFILTIMLACYVMAIPMFMIGNYFFRPFSWISNNAGFFEQNLINILCCCLRNNGCGQTIIYICLWLMYQPRAILYSVIISPIKLTMMVCSEFCNIFQ